MKTIVLYNSKLFETLLDIDFEENNLDIHNDYEIKNILYKNNNLQFLLVHNTSTHKILFSFYDVEIIEFDFLIMNTLTIDNFYRGRYEFNNELFDEFNNKKCFYIEFCETGQINILCSKLILSEL